MEAVAPTVPSEETSDAGPREGGLARGEHDEDVGAGGGEQEDCEEEAAPPVTITEADRRSREGGLARAEDDEDVGVEGGVPAKMGTGSGLHCARCGRVGVEEIGDADDGTWSRRARPAGRPRRAPWAMTSTTESAKPCPIATIGATLRRARCRQPAQVERMKQSLMTHGQLTPLVVAARPEGVEVVDGFKRLAAATSLGWTTLLVVVRPLDETGQWAAMLLLNRGPSSMTTLEEALVLRELCKTGLTQVEIAALCSRHKTWVSRRVGLVERLHPELIEAVKLGLLHPGSARRLLSLPPGNQLEMAAAVESARLGPRDTELLVSLWHRTKEPSGRRGLLSEPRASLSKHHPETRRPPLDPRLSAEGQRLCRCLRRLDTVVTEASRRLRAPPPTKDLAILDKDLRAASVAASRLTTELGSARTTAGASESEGSGASN
jgi:ParB/RepB/Spo0J family partition protein